MSRLPPPLRHSDRLATLVAQGFVPSLVRPSVLLLLLPSLAFSQFLPTPRMFLSRDRSLAFKSLDAPEEAKGEVVAVRRARVRVRVFPAPKGQPPLQGVACLGGVPAGPAQLWAECGPRLCSRNRRLRRISLLWVQPRAELRGEACPSNEASADPVLRLNLGPSSWKGKSPLGPS
eukprot:1402629-Pyramimonas_sp.AAC.1